LLLAGVFCLAPLLVYLVWLSYVTRRNQPTILAGPWDFTALLAGLSGFILFGGALLLALLRSNVRHFLMRGNLQELRDAWAESLAKEQLAGTLMIVLYLGFVVGGSYLSLQNRRRTLVVYNVDSEAFEAAVRDVFEQLGRPVERRGKQFVAGVPLCEVDSFEGGRTVQLRWLSDDAALLQGVDRHLRQSSKTLAPMDNPAARWISTSVVAVGAILVFIAGLVVYFRRSL
jgi:hypothetical protein